MAKKAVPPPAKGEELGEPAAGGGGDAFGEDAPYQQPISNLLPLATAPFRFELLTFYGMLMVLDSLLYCVVLLWFRIIQGTVLSVFHLVRRRQDDRNLWVAAQGLAVIFAYEVVHYFDMSGAAYSFIRGPMDWAKLYTLFQTMVILHALLAAVGDRVMGSLVFAFKQRQQRIVTTMISSFYVLLHASLLFALVASTHVSLDKGREFLSFMLSVEITELKEVKFASLTRAQLFKSCLGDIVQRFRWAFMLVVIYLDKASRYTDEQMEERMPIFFNAVGVTVFVLVLIDWIKHISFIIPEPKKGEKERSVWERTNVYREYLREMLLPYLHAPWIGINSKQPKTTARLFNFISLPFTVTALHLISMLAWRAPNPAVAFFAIMGGCFALKLFLRGVLKLSAAWLCAKTGKAGLGSSSLWTHVR